MKKQLLAFFLTVIMVFGMFGGIAEAPAPAMPGMEVPDYAGTVAGDEPEELPAEEEAEPEPEAEPETVEPEAFGDETEETEPLEGEGTLFDEPEFNGEESEYVRPDDLIIKADSAEEDILALQEQLCTLGWLDERYVTGKLDNMTTLAVKSFQSYVNLTFKAGLAEDGSVGQKTFAWLDKGEEVRNPNAESTGEEIVYDPEEEVQLDELTTTALDQLGDMKHILLLGMDLRPGQTVSRTDTMIIMSLDTKHNKIKLTSLMRDTYVEIPGRKSNRLNACTVFGGPELLQKTIYKNFGLKIEDYVIIDLENLVDVIDQLGGLWLYVEDSKVPRVNAVIKGYNKMNGLNLNGNLLKKGGYQLMNGLQAESWARYRYGDPQGDAGRNARQRQLIMLMMDQLKNKSMMELMAFATNNIDKVQTNMTLSDIITLLPAIYSFADAEIEELKLPADGAYKNQRVSGMAVLVPDRNKNVQALADFLAN